MPCFSVVIPPPLETCGCVADFNIATSKLTIYLTSQAPHAHRTLFAIVGGIPEQNIRVISPDIGGVFGNKVPIYPCYFFSLLSSLSLFLPFISIYSLSYYLLSTFFSLFYHITAFLSSYLFFFFLFFSI